nr:hypothetical protein [Lentzea pudingi]
MGAEDRSVASLDHGGEEFPDHREQGVERHRHQLAQLLGAQIDGIDELQVCGGAVVESGGVTDLPANPLGECGHEVGLRQVGRHHVRSDSLFSQLRGELIQRSLATGDQDDFIPRFAIPPGDRPADTRTGSEHCNRFGHVVHVMSKPQRGQTIHG